MNKAFYCTPIDGKLGLEKFDVAQWIQTSPYTLRIVNNIAETNFFLKLKREDSSAKQLRYGAKKLVAKRQVTVGRKCLAACRDEKRMNTLHNNRSFFAFFRLAKVSV